MEHSLFHVSRCLVWYKASSKIYKKINLKTWKLKLYRSYFRPSICFWESDLQHTWNFINKCLKWTSVLINVNQICTAILFSKVIFPEENCLNFLQSPPSDTSIFYWRSYTECINIKIMLLLRLHLVGPSTKFVSVSLVFVQLTNWHSCTILNASALAVHHSHEVGCHTFIWIVQLISVHELLFISVHRFCIT